MSRAVMKQVASVLSRVGHFEWGMFGRSLCAPWSVLALCGVSWGVLAACSSAAPPAPPPKAPVTTAARVGEARQCVDDKDQRVQCTADSDCCPHFVCGKDPDLSQAVDYCIFGG